MKIQYKKGDESIITRMINSCKNRDEVDNDYRKLIGALSLSSTVDEAKKFCADHIPNLTFVSRGAEYNVEFPCGVQLSLHRTARGQFYTGPFGNVTAGAGVRVFLKSSQ